MMGSKDYVVMELLTDDPNRKYRVFQIFAHFYVFQGFENSQKPELSLLADAF